MRRNVWRVLTPKRGCTLWITLFSWHWWRCLKPSCQHVYLIQPLVLWLLLHFVSARRDSRGLLGDCHCEILCAISFSYKSPNVSLCYDLVSASPFERLLQSCRRDTPLNFHPLFSCSSSPIHLPVEQAQAKVLFARVSKMFCSFPYRIVFTYSSCFCHFPLWLFFTLMQNKRISYAFLKKSCQHSTKVFVLYFCGDIALDLFYGLCSVPAWLYYRDLWSVWWLELISIVSCFSPLRNTLYQSNSWQPLGLWPCHFFHVWFSIVAVFTAISSF